jgi:2'-5' RNA ligase
VAEGVILLLDEHAERAVLHLWRTLEDAGIPSLATHSHRRHQPHVTLVVADRVVPGGIASMRGEPLQLVGPGVFGGDGGFLFLTVAPTRRLLEEQAVLEAAAEDVWPDYRPGVWLPHVTLAAGLSDAQLAEGVGICRRLSFPILASVREVSVADPDTGKQRRV